MSPQPNSPPAPPAARGMSMPLTSLRPLAVTLATLLAFATIVDASAVEYKNDAGSGRDAPETEATALALAGYGSYMGYLLPNDNDWYRVDKPGGPSCVESRIAGEATANASLVVVNGATRRVAYAPLSPSGAVLAFATPGVTSVRSGFTSPLNGYYPHGGYGFGLTATTGASAGDAGTGADAPSSLAAAVPIVAGCIDGDIAPKGALMGDTRDAYLLPVKAGDVGVFSLATRGGAPVTLQITDGSTVLATLVSGEVTGVSFPTSGPYYMTASSMSLTSSETFDYLVGVILGPPDPCRPHCIMSS